MKRLVSITASLLTVCGLYAITGDTYRSVRLNPNEGTNNVKGSILVANQGDCLSIPAPTRPGYTFGGWNGVNSSEKYLIQSVIQNVSIHDEIDFDGTSSYYDLGRDYMFTDAITVNLWAYMDNWVEYATGGMRMISCTQTGGWNIEPTSTTETGRFRFAGHDGTGYKHAASLVECADLATGWHMFTFTFDGNNMKGYIDGKHVASGKRFASGAINYNATNSILVGAEAGDSNIPDATPDYFKGKIRGLSINNTALSTAGVSALYAAYISIDKTTTQYILPAETEQKELVATWIANEPSTLTIDVLGGNNSMEESSFSQPIGSNLVVTAPTYPGSNFLGWDNMSSQYISNYQGIACSTPDEIEFDGTSTYFDLGRDRMYSDAITINVWAYMDNWADYSANKTMRIYSCTEGGGLGLEPYNSAIHFSTYDSKRNGTGGYHGALSGILWSELTPGWHMFTHIFDGVKVLGYLDGQLIASSTEFEGEIGYNTTNSILIGAETDKDGIADSDPKYFKGKIKSFAIMHTAISATDVAELYSIPDAARFYFQPENVTMTATWDKLPTTGIESVNLDTFDYTISNDMLTVTGINAETIEIYNLTGQCLRKTTQQNQISIEELHGTYILQIQTTNKTHTEKIIIK